DLGAASARLRGAGFDVRPGGRHVGFGTENAICRFGLDYLELITVHDAAEAERASDRSRELAQYLSRHESGYVGFALAGDDLTRIAERLRAIGVPVEGPTPMRRQRPDGTVLEWQLMIPGGVAWRRPWPFFIAWGLPDDRRLALERPGTHENGATGIAGISIAVADLAPARELYEAMLGPATDGPGGGLRFHAGDVEVDVMAPIEGSHLLERGPGPFEVRLRLAPGTAGSPIEPLPQVRFSFEGSSR
ncbi:MAG: VOC family protein, partial [Candidatus Rokubacteria bacterium]|nr:VOC family protein [Candidatus Rokubacteria bacterium]